MLSNLYSVIENFLIFPFNSSNKLELLHMNDIS